MRRLRAYPGLKTGALLAALASMAACASHPGTATAIARPSTPSIRPLTGPGDKTYCMNSKTLRCMKASIVQPGANRGLLSGSVPTRSANSSRGSGIDNARWLGEALTPAAFLDHVRSCARQYPIILQAPSERVLAIGMHESGLRPLAIHDNETGISLFPNKLEQAVALAMSLHEAGHRIDAGVMQITEANWPAYGLTVDSVFDVHTNICAGARILGEAYQIERRAACRYNTGRPDCANGYPESIDRAAASIRLTRPSG